MAFRYLVSSLTIYLISINVGVVFEEDHVFHCGSHFPRVILARLNIEARTRVHRERKHRDRSQTTLLELKLWISGNLPTMLLSSTFLARAIDSPPFA